MVHDPLCKVRKEKRELVYLKINAINEGFGERVDGGGEGGGGQGGMQKGNEKE